MANKELYAATYAENLVAFDNDGKVNGSMSASYIFKHIRIASTSDVGLVRLGSDTRQTATRYSTDPTSEDERTFPIQLDSNYQMVVNIPKETTSFTQKTYQIGMYSITGSSSYSGTYTSTNYRINLKATYIDNVIYLIGGSYAHTCAGNTWYRFSISTLPTKSFYSIVVTGWKTTSSTNSRAAVVYFPGDDYVYISFAYVVDGFSIQFFF